MEEEIHGMKIHGLKLEVYKQLSDNDPGWLNNTGKEQIIYHGHSLEDMLKEGKFVILPKREDEPPPSSIDGDYDDNCAFDFCIQWWELRKQWVAAASGPNNGVYGPYSLGDVAKEKLLMMYDLTKDDVPMDNVAFIPPKELLDIRSRKYLTEKVEPVLD